ncbi:MAG: transglycosylase SLT domain-containing protein [Thiobacillus sp.]|nr:transglycosylase SLT domain-containing protein [Thiobacillus sp.]MDP2057703.1 transglycosylase SLT domain-containing protein [Thiobacillus sp.]
MPRIFFIILVALAAPAQADVYAYADADGVEHYTNAPGNSLYQRISSLLVESGKNNRANAPAVRGNVAAFAPHIEQAAGEAGIDVALVHAVITAESGYNPAALSRTGAQGLMQLMPGTARRYAVKDAFDPKQNIRGGTRYLRDLLNMFDNNTELALAAYNAGENAVIRYGRKIPPYRETQAYVPKVMRLYSQYSVQL